MINELNETLHDIENLNKLLKKGLITFSEFLNLKIKLYEKANKINEILELEHEYKNALTPISKQIFKQLLDTRKEEN